MEWLEPVGINLKKLRPAASEDWKASTSLDEERMSMNALLPLHEDTDALVAFYINHLEYLHRVVHIPTFRKEYATFWAAKQSRSSEITALVLAILAISACASNSSGDHTSIECKFRTIPVPWILACEQWLSRQSLKHRRLAHYQVSCLVYLAKRMNMINKKRYWIETGSNLIQSAIIDGLPCDAHSVTDGPFTREMKRRIWHTVRELDLQNAYEYGLPTLLHNIESIVEAPANIDDEEFDDTSADIPPSKPNGHYARTSYQSLSARSWKLRLEISRHLHSPAFSQPLSYDEVLHYTHEVTQTLHDLPAWNTEEPLPCLAHAFLKFQLMECILALHRPYLHRENSKFWLSQNISHQMSQEVLLLNRRLDEQGAHSLAQLREDLLLASLTLTRITMLQSPGRSPPSATLICLLWLHDAVLRLTCSSTASTSIVMINSTVSIQLLEQCLPLTGKRYLRCYNSEPWCFLTMYATAMLLKVHLGKEQRRTAKYSCAQMFLELHRKHVQNQQMSVPSQWQHHQQQPPAQDLYLGSEDVSSRFYGYGSEQAYNPANRPRSLANSCPYLVQS